MRKLRDSDVLDLVLTAMNATAGNKDFIPDGMYGDQAARVHSGFEGLLDEGQVSEHQLREAQLPLLVSGFGPEEFEADGVDGDCTRSALAEFNDWVHSSMLDTQPMGDEN